MEVDAFFGGANAELLFGIGLAYRTHYRHHFIRDRKRFRKGRDSRPAVQSSLRPARLSLRQAKTRPPRRAAGGTESSDQLTYKPHWRGGERTIERPYRPRITFVVVLDIASSEHPAMRFAAFLANEDAFRHRASAASLIAFCGAEMTR
jgi:hypothetical protein